MEIKTCDFSILCNEFKIFLLLTIETNNVHKFIILMFKLWIFFKNKNKNKYKYPSLAHFIVFSPLNMIKQNQNNTK
jgi:hypothetical protein